MFGAVSQLYLCLTIKGVIKQLPITFRLHTGEEKSAVGARQPSDLETPKARQGSEGIACMMRNLVRRVAQGLGWVSTYALLRRLSSVMLLLEPALGTTDFAYNPWRDLDFCMGLESQHGSPNPADAVKSPQAGSQGGFSISGMDLFASLDMDALLGTAASSAAQPRAPAASDLPASHAALVQTSCPVSYAPSHSRSEAMPHQPYPQASRIHPMLPQARSVQTPQAFPPQTSLAHPQVAPINLLIAQTPAISIARGGQSSSAEAGQLSLGPMPGWTSISAPMAVSEDTPLTSAQVRSHDAMACLYLSA